MGTPGVSTLGHSFRLCSVAFLFPLPAFHHSAQVLTFGKYSVHVPFAE